jgi:hypothetical protein
LDSFFEADASLQTKHNNLIVLFSLLEQNTQENRGILPDEYYAIFKMIALTISDKKPKDNLKQLIAN